MYELMSLPLDCGTWAEYGSWAALRQELRTLHCDGIEAIWGGEDFPAGLPQELVIGYHLTFFPDWLDFWREDETAPRRKFGSLEAARAFYGGWGAEHLLRYYQDDLARAQQLGAQYVVFHVSDVSVEEDYTYRWLHESRAVIDAAAELANRLLPAHDAGFAFLMENQWWPGLTLTDPALTQRLLDAVAYPNRGLLLDTGHLMNTELSLRTQAQGAAYIHKMLDAHGALCAAIRAVHLHRSLSGAYVAAHTGRLPEDFPSDYLAQFAASYGHILQIDQHQPWTDGAVRELVARIAPDYLVHELTGRRRAARFAAIQTQTRTLHTER